MRDFFVSYNSADEVWAVWIAWVLEEADYTVYIQAWDFLSGSNFVLEMDRASKESRHTIAVLSPSYLSALYTQPEWAAAFATDPTGKDRRLIPVRVRDCKLEGLLAPMVYIDFVGLEEDKARTKLLVQARPGRAKPSEAPAFPGRAHRQVPKRPAFPTTRNPSGLLPRRPAVAAVTELSEGKQVNIPLDAIRVDAHGRAYLRRDAARLSDDAPRVDAARLGAVSQRNSLVLYLPTVPQGHRWAMDQRVGLGDPKLLPIIYVQQDQFQVIVPKDDPYHQDTLPPAYLEFTIHELASSILPPGRYSIAAQDIMVTGEYEGDERFWLRKKAIARDGDALDIRLKRESHTRPKCIVLSVAHMREHLGRVSNSRNVSPEIERDYIEASSLPILL